MEHSARPVRSTVETRRLLKVSLGKTPADLTIRNACVLNVYTGEFLEDMEIGVCGRWIAAVEQSGRVPVGPRTRTIDAGGRTVIPGLIDAHTHLIWLNELSDYLRHLIPGGTTTLVTETFEAYPVAGAAGVNDFIAAASDQPINIFVSAPPMISISPALDPLPVDTLRRFLQRPECIGLGESYWQALVQDPDDLLPLYTETLRWGKRIEGHSAGASARKLTAYAAAGVSSCHEPIDAAGVVERLRLGMYAMVREGSIRRDLAEIVRRLPAGVDRRRLILVTDGLSPHDLLDKGGMEYVVQKAVDCGLEPLDAIRAATLNPAEHLGLDHLIGGIAPGRQADLLVIPEPSVLRPAWVICRGRAIARDGRLRVEPRRHRYARASRRTIRMPRDLRSSDFRITAPNATGCVSVRVIDLITDLVTREAVISMAVTDGEVRGDPGRNIAKVAAVDRGTRPGECFTGLIRGFGLREGALACSAAWDTSVLIVVGHSGSDMALAVNRIAQLQGGAVLTRDGEILQEIPLPVFGIMTDLSVRELADRLDRLRTGAAGLGVKLQDPLLSLVVLTAAAIPFLRLCESGLIDLKSGRGRGLFVE